jgi:hypothetical protein
MELPGLNDRLNPTKDWSAVMLERNVKAICSKEKVGFVFFEKTPVPECPRRACLQVTAVRRHR